MKIIGHFINGREVASQSDRLADIFNPATGEVQNRVSLGLASELDDAVKKAMKAQPEWAATNPQRRDRRRLHQNFGTETKGKRINNFDVLFDSLHINL